MANPEASAPQIDAAWLRRIQRSHGPDKPGDLLQLTFKSTVCLAQVMEVQKDWCRLKVITRDGMNGIPGGKGATGGTLRCTFEQLSHMNPRIVERGEREGLMAVIMRMRDDARRHVRRLVG